MTSFSERIGRCVKRGDLTVSDLARWFDRPRATVNTWLRGRTPYGPSGRKALADLEALERAIDERGGAFPIPVALTWQERIAYLSEHRDGGKRHNRVSPVRPSR